MSAVGDSRVPVNLYEERAEAFWQAEVETLYRSEAGLGNNGNLAETYSEFSDLFSQKQIQTLIESARLSADSNFRYLAEFAVMRYLRRVAMPYDEEFFGQLGPATLEWEGGQVPFFATTQILASEADTQRRQRLYNGRSQLVAQHNDVRRKRWQAVSNEVSALGYDNYYALCNELRGLRLVNLQFMAERFLADTAVPYFQALTRWSKHILDLSVADAADMFYLMRGKQFDPLFPPDQLETAVYETAAYLGVSLQEFAGLEIDMEARPNKSPRPFTAFVKVPDEIKLVVNPIGGHQDFKAVFHELGHALHGLHIPANLPFVTRYLGDDTVGEAYAFLFERLPANPVWLREVYGLSDCDEYVDFMKFIRLLFVRRCAAKVLYENQLHSGVTNPEKLYETLLQEHLGLKISSAYYLLDVDDGFYNAQYFRAWMLSAQLEAVLESRIGKDWVVSTATTAFLRPLWQKGQPSAEVLSILIGQDGLNPDALSASFTKNW